MWIRMTGRILALLWALWWTFFGLSSGMNEGLDQTNLFMHILVPGLFFLITAIIAWRWTIVGSVLLMLEGLFVVIGYPILTGARAPISTLVYILVTMALPPLVAGFLLLMEQQRQVRQSQPSMS